MKAHSETKLAVATAEIIDAIHFNQHRRIYMIKSTYSRIGDEFVPKIEIIMHRECDCDDGGMGK